MYRSLSAWGSAVFRARAREPKTKIPGACKFHQESPQRREEQGPETTAGTLVMALHSSFSPPSHQLKCSNPCVQELLASLPQPSVQDWDATLEQGVQQEVTSNHNDLQADSPRSAMDRSNEGLLLGAVKQDDATTEEAGPSASEDQLQETVTELKWPTRKTLLYKCFPTPQSKRQVLHGMVCHAQYSACGIDNFTMTVWADQCLFFFFFKCISFALPLAQSRENNKLPLTYLHLVWVFFIN